MVENRFHVLRSSLLLSLIHILRSVNECLLGYVANGTKFYDTSIFFAAYVNEENPMIDQLLREALNTRIVNRFLGYQSTAKGCLLYTSRCV